MTQNHDNSPSPETTPQNSSVSKRIKKREETTLTTRFGQGLAVISKALRPDERSSASTAEKISQPQSNADAPAPVNTTSGFSRPSENFYNDVGGKETFKKLVDVFYSEVAEDTLLRAMYPEEDLKPAAERLQLFLEQYWGGPNTYSTQRGHPRLRMRHHSFKVTPHARDRWLVHMRTAVDALDLPPLYETELWDYLERAAHAMVNSTDEQ